MKFFLHITKKSIRSIAYLIFFTALVHIGVMTVNSIYFKDVKVFNYFRVISLDTYFPRITNGHLSDVISLLILVILFVVFWFFQKSHKKITK
ncbi:MAG: hypothetical protein WCG91_01590 [Candidatus Shapirobacteria bacterium]